MLRCHDIMGGENYMILIWQNDGDNIIGQCLVTNRTKVYKLNILF